MNEMVFSQPLLDNGKPRPNRWVSECGTYHIARYRYWRRDGRTCGPEDECEPYFRAHLAKTGESLTETRNEKLSSFEVAAGVCMDHRDGKR